MASVKIACLGAGGGYFPGALGDIAVTPGLAGSEVTLYDLDLDKAELMAKLGRRFTAQAGTALRVRACADLADALDGASFAVSAIGGSGASMGNVYGTAVHNADIAIPAKYGIYQLIGDTGGPAGMMMGLRSIPVYLGICREMEKRCPEAFLVNHSNPMAVLCRALTKHSGIRVIGICHGVQNSIERVAELLGVEPEELEAVWIGTNHYYWFTRLRRHGRDVYPEVMAKTVARQDPPGQVLTGLLSRAYGYRLGYYSDDHTVEFYPFLAQVRDPAEMPYGLGGHAHARYAMPEPEREMPAAEQEALRKRQLQQLSEELDKRVLPDPSRSAIRGEMIGTLLEAIATGRREVRIVNIPNDGVVSNLPDYAILEVEAVTDSGGLRGIRVGEAPLALAGLLHKRIAWQELVADAGATGDRRLALQALLLDEMAIPPEKAAAMLDELLAASRHLLPQFA